MSAQIVFLTLFLGLTSGIQPIELHLVGPIKAVRIMSGDRQLALLTASPWQAKVDFGPLLPQQLVAIGFDADGNEIARTSQLINLPRPRAELEIALTSHGKQTFASLRWRHLASMRPTAARMSVDGVPLSLNADYRAELPLLDPLTPHIISAEMRFEDGFVARKELVIQGLRSDATGTQLTPVLLSTNEKSEPKTFDGCFSVSGISLRVNAVEKPPARVILVQDPNPGDAVGKLERVLNTLPAGAVGELAPDTSVRIQWPIGRSYGDKNDRAPLFDRSPDFKSMRLSMSWFLTRSFADRARLEDPRHFAEAVAVAGLNSMYDGVRRAVVFVLNDRKKDVSEIDPKQVRDYLAALGVPLFVWSLTGPRPDLAATWGPVDDISNPSLLFAATKRLRAALDSQRIAWIAVDPLTALRIDGDEECGLSPVANARAQDKSAVARTP